MNKSPVARSMICGTEKKKKAKFDVWACLVIRVQCMCVMMALMPQVRPVVHCSWALREWEWACPLSA